LLFLFFGAASLPAFELKLNGQPLSLPAETLLRGLCYLVPTDAGYERGLALSELLPPLIDSWKLEILHEKGASSWKEERLAERLGGFFLLPSIKGGWDFYADDVRLKDIRSIYLAGDRAEEGELEVWLSWEGVPELKAELERWSKLSGVKVRAVDVPDTRSKYLTTLRGGGRTPDLVMIQSDNLADLLNAQALQNLDRIEAGSLSAKGREAFRIEGRLWALPFYFDSQLVFYNKKLISEVPKDDWSLDDLVRIADSAAAKGRTPLSWNVYSAYWLLSFASGFGKPSICDADGGVRPDDPGTAKALAWILGLIGSGRLLALERDAMVARFAAGEIGMILSGSYSIPEFERIGLDFAVAPYPTVASTGRPAAPLLDFKGFAMSRSCRSPVSAQRLLEYLGGIGVQQRFSGALSKMPANEQAWKAAKESNRYHAQLSRSAEIGLVIPPGPGYAVYKNIMWKMLRFILSSMMESDEALAEARRLIDANLKAK
jgi:ABC-type glycerol-3-phosphate transport system substrate-binding protein